MLQVIATVVVTLGCDAVFAATSGAPRQNPAAAGLLLGLAFAYLSRRRKIGGWLLYYYIQHIMSAALLLLVSLPLISKQIDPAEWKSTSLYVWYLLSTAPLMAVLAIEVVLAVVLLIRRDTSTLRRLCTIQLALAWTSAATLCIDFIYFNEKIFFDIYSLFFAVIWAWYFRKSTRVQQVFVYNNWDFEKQQAEKRIPTAAELRYVWMRAAVFGAIVFVLLLVMMGSALGDKQPDVDIFYVPLFYATIAAALGRLLPIREKKRKALNGTSAEP